MARVNWPMVSALLIPAFCCVLLAGVVLRPNVHS